MRTTRTMRTRALSKSSSIGVSRMDWVATPLLSLAPLIGTSSTRCSSDNSTSHHLSNAQNAQATRSGQEHEPAQEPERKRKPGRPRGSKNRKPRAVSQVTTRQDPHPYQPPGTQSQPAPQHPDPNTQTQQFYEFQWRILNLCAEFYGAAEELIVSTNSPWSISPVTTILKRKVPRLLSLRNATKQDLVAPVIP